MAWLLTDCRVLSHPALRRGERVLRSTDHDTGLIAGLVPRNHIDGVYFPEFCNVTTIVTSCRCSTPVSPRRRRRRRTAWQGTMFPGTFCLPQATFRNSYDAFASGKVVIFFPPAPPVLLLSCLEAGWLVYVLLPRTWRTRRFLRRYWIGPDDYAVVNPRWLCGLYRQRSRDAGSIFPRST